MDFDTMFRFVRLELIKQYKVWRAELFRRYLELAQFTYGCHVRSGCKYLNTRIRPHFCDYNDKPVKSEAFT